MSGILFQSIIHRLSLLIKYAAIWKTTTLREITLALKDKLNDISSLHAIPGSLTESLLAMNQKQNLITRPFVAFLDKANDIMCQTSSTNAQESESAYENH
ncbi:hypothetical protein RhiirA4_464032 [Rhizophagus irregularis]|uniref:Uncharacterized protein n=1 Tax=Rhizophagus irregularis TaxID=588596 RepID=A0A2I1GP74_9GLOM|nr:hypothetical protein RhiirA4_464032 [Rhizophagus irregularis]